MTILNSTPIVSTKELIGIIIAIIVFSCAFSLVITANQFDERLFVVISAIFIAISLLIILPVEYSKTKLNRLEVIFEKDYPIEDVYNKYDVKGRRGEIWVLEEKGDDTG